MSCRNFLNACCGEGEEETKYSGIVADPADLARELGWNNDPSDCSNHQRIQSFEHQINTSRHHPNNHRKTVMGRHISIDESYEPPIISKSPSEESFLSSVVSESFLFLDVNDSLRVRFVQALQEERVKASTTIIQQGETGDFFYILQEGTVRFEQNQETVGQGGARTCFGELALLYDTPRAASVVAETDCRLWKVDVGTFRHIVFHHHADGPSFDEMKALIESIELFQHLDSSAISKLIKSFTTVPWNAGTRIVQKGSPGSVFYIVQSGQIRVHDIGLGDSSTDDLILNSGNYFGERALLTGEPRAANVTAVSDVVTYAVDRETFELYLGTLESLMEKEMRKQSLRSIPLFAHLSKPDIGHLSEICVEICYNKGAHLSEIGKPYQMKLWIIKHGTVLVYSEKRDTLFTLQPGDFFGDKSVKGDLNHVSSHKAVCESKVSAWVLSRDDIEAVVGDLDRLGATGKFEKHKRQRMTSLASLKKHKVLGQGAFGKVWLVSHGKGSSSGDKQAFALKTISKAQIVDSGLVKAVQREKELLHILNHPFLLGLEDAFQDASYLYLLLPVIPGGELYDVLLSQKKGGRGLTNDSACFYCACIIEALGHLHQREIAYRDLKLENVLLDADGYGVIVDLGFAKVVHDKTFTLCGTPEYLAPETIMSKGHDHAVDDWAFGVLTYELLVGVTPFYDRFASQTDMFRKIVLVQYEIPDFVDGDASALIEGLLVRKQSKRLGNLARGPFDIKESDWFKKARINFGDLVRKRIKAPWKPAENSSLDIAKTASSFVGTDRDASRRLTREEQEMFRDF